MRLDRRFPGVFERVATGEERLSDAHARHGTGIAESERSVRESMLSDERRERLRLPQGRPAPVVERVGPSSTGEPPDVRRLCSAGATGSPWSRRSSGAAGRTASCGRRAVREDRHAVEEP